MSDLRSISLTKVRAVDSTFPSEGEVGKSTMRRSVDSESPNRNLERLSTLLLIREGDLEEEHLIRQGRGWIHIPGSGHEALAAIAEFLGPDDLLFLYYRDRALAQARGVSPLDMAREHLANARSASGGRMMPMHGSYHRLGIYPPVTPTGSQCLPAVGAAWGLRMAGFPRVVVCTIGDASTRQGEFYEAVAFAVQEKLPIVFAVEDNGYGISTPTARQLPFRLDLFSDKLFQRIDGRSYAAVHAASRDAIELCPTRRRAVNSMARVGQADFTYEFRRSSRLPFP